MLSIYWRDLEVTPFCDSDIRRHSNLQSMDGSSEAWPALADEPASFKGAEQRPKVPLGP